MKVLNLNKKSGFSSLLPFKIYDVDGFIWYSSNFTDHIEKGERLYFNLPKGKYFLEGSIQYEPKPFEHEKIILPKPQRKIELKNYKIVFKNNPNKCTIYYKLGLIVFDNSFKNKPLFFRYNIYFHEIGHHLYKDEHLADLFAAKKLLELGFNSTQIGLTNLLTLSDKQDFRKQFIVDNLIKSNYGYKR